MAPIVLGYWDLRGLASTIRLVLEQAGAEWVDKLYKCGPPPTFDRSEWLADKHSLGLDFPNLPYLIDGDVKISQSGVILRYLARKFGLDGKTEADRIRVELLAAQLNDYHMDAVRIVYNPEFKNLVDDYKKGVPDKLKALTKFLGNNQFVCGDYVTYADFLLFENLEIQQLFTKDILKDFPELEAFHKRILALPAVDKYYKSDRAIKYPFNGAPAYFGGAYSDILNKQ